MAALVRDFAHWRLARRLFIGLAKYLARRVTADVNEITSSRRRHIEARWRR